MSEPGNELPEAGAEPSDYVADVSFEDLNLSEPVRRGIAERGYRAPTPVQAQAIPKVLSGKDLIVRSKTGTGKTAAFGIPMIEKLTPGTRQPRALVLCPTRELAIQVAEELSALAGPKELKVVAIYGGAPMKQQTDALEEGVEIVVGTPGRVYDHIRRKNLDLSKAQFGVLDEADEMLNQGFYEEVTRILEKLPNDRQTLLFSATVPPDIERLIKRFCKDPETLLLSGDVFTVEGIDNVLYHTVDSYPKPRNLIYLMELEEPENAIVFCNTRDDTSLVTAVLNRNGFDAEVLNGDLPQKERERVMAKVKRGELEFLVATDIAARGIDISDLSHVINYSLPEDPAVYLHRVGRTGRIGKKGTAISLVGGKELVTLTALEKRYGIKFEERKLPTPEEARKRWADRHLKEIKDAAQNVVWDAMLSLAQELRTNPEGERHIAFLLKYFFTHHRIEKIAERGEPAPAEQPREAREPREGRERGGRGRDRDREHGRREERREERKDERRREPDPEPPASEERGAKLWCNLGADTKLESPALAEAVAQLAGVEREKIREIELKPTYSYLFVDPASADALVAATGKERDGKKVRIERPRARR